jgi:hypothetical protein
MHTLAQGLTSNTSMARQSKYSSVLAQSVMARRFGNIQATRGLQAI